MDNVMLVAKSGGEGAVEEAEAGEYLVLLGHLRVFSF